MLIHSDLNNMNSMVYHLIIVRYLMKTLHWYFPWAAASHLYNMTGRGEKLQQLHCYHQFSDSLDIYLTKNHYENYSPKMVPIAKIWGSGSWTNWPMGNIFQQLLRRSQRATPRVRRALMTPPLTSPTRFTFTHRFNTADSTIWRVVSCSARTRHFRPRRVLRRTGTDWSPSHSSPLFFLSQ